MTLMITGCYRRKRERRQRMNVRSGSSERRYSLLWRRKKREDWLRNERLWGVDCPVKLDYAVLWLYLKLSSLNLRIGDVIPVLYEAISSMYTYNSWSSTSVLKLNIGGAFNNEVKNGVIVGCRVVKFLSLPAQTRPIIYVSDNRLCMIVLSVRRRQVLLFIMVFGFQPKVWSTYIDEQYCACEYSFQGQTFFIILFEMRL